VTPEALDAEPVGLLHGAEASEMLDKKAVVIHQLRLHR